VSPDHSVGSPPAATNLKMTQWRFAVEYVVRSQNVESRLHAVEGVYYVGPGTIVPRDDGRGLPKWQEALYIAMERNSVHVSDFLRLPNDSVVLIGRQVAI
jgi:KUP system potassium uptake protein